MKISSRRHGLPLLAISLSILFLIVCFFAAIRSTAQSAPQETKELPPWEVKVVGPQHPVKRAEKVDINAMTERIIENQIPFHIPIKVEFNNLDKEPLLRNLEVKVTNIGKKPIYFLELDVNLPKNIFEDGNSLVYPLRYGRIEFIDIFEEARPEDVPIQPGESYIFKISENELNASESYMAQRNTPLAAAKLIYLFFYHLNFGDKTGFSTNTGIPLPHANPKKVSGNLCQPMKEKEQTNIDITGSPPTYRINSFFSHFSSSIPFAKGNNSYLKSSTQAVCCPGPAYSSCTFLKDSTYSCNYCGTGNTAVTTSCNDPLGDCSDEYQQNRTCTDMAGNTGICVEHFRLPCPPPFPGCFNIFQIPAAAPDLFCDYCCGESPIIIDVRGNGYQLTGARDGVDFDLNNDSVAERLGWTAADSDDAFLALDRNGNGSIDNGTEVFGNFSPQPRSDNPNGFASLAEFDTANGGGNNDGAIDSSDAVFAALRLWQDTNHNGISEAGELHTMAEARVVSFSLNYKETPSRDRHGNRFRYVAPFKLSSGARVLREREAWDVYPVKG